MGSGSTTYPLAQGGLFTPPSGMSNIKWNRILDGVNIPTMDVTGVCEGTTDVAREFVQGVTNTEWLGQGVVTAGSCSTYGAAQAMTYTLTGSPLSIKLVEWTLRKVWPLIPVHNNATEEYVWGFPTIQVSANGWATGASGPGMATKLLTAMTLNIDGVGSISCGSGGKGVIGSLEQDANFQAGGGIAVAFSALYSGKVAYDGGEDTPFAWLFPDLDVDPDSPVKGSATLTTGETRTNSVLAYDVMFNNPSQIGGPVRVATKFRFDAA